MLQIGAVSTTGQGEAIMRVVLAADILNRMRGGTSCYMAARDGLSNMRKRVGGVGGCIVLKRNGEWAACCTTSRMAWACVDANGILCRYFLHCNFAFLFSFASLVA